MDEREVQGRVMGWYRRARAERDVVSRFVFLWFCFNAWLAFESNEDRDRAMINWLKGSAARRSELRASFDVAAAAATSLFPGYLKTLADMSPVISTGRTYREARVESADDFGGIVETIYQVRCNLFHGGKRTADLRDQKLVTVSARILEKWIGNLVAGWASST